MFADAMLPIQIQIILSLKSVNYNRTLKEVVSAFFQRHFDIIKEVNVGRAERRKHQ